MTREIRITKTFRIVMTWTVMQQAMQKRKAPEVGGGTDLAQRRGVGGGTDLSQNQEQPHFCC